MMVPMLLSHMSLAGSGFALVFCTSDRRRVLPVGISLPEAQAFLHPRASSAHDLSKRFLDMLECRVDHIELRELRKGIAVCRIVTRLPSGDMGSLDARVGDAAALALRAHVPVLVEDTVLDKIGLAATAINLPAGSADAAPSEDEPVPPPSDSECLAEARYRLGDAVAHEQYEEAAKLRDEVRRLLRHVHKHG